MTITGKKPENNIILTIPKAMLFVLEWEYKSTGHMFISDLRHKQYFNIAPSQMTYCIKNLQKKGFITTRKIGRKKDITITSAGREFVREYPNRVRHDVDEFYAFLFSFDINSNREKVSINKNIPQDLIISIPLYRQVFGYLDENPSSSYSVLCNEYSNENKTTLRSYMNQWYKEGINELNKKLVINDG